MLSALSHWLLIFPTDIRATVHSFQPGFISHPSLPPISIHLSPAHVSCQGMCKFSCFKSTASLGLQLQMGRGTRRSAFDGIRKQSSETVFNLLSSKDRWVRPLVVRVR